MKTEENNIEPIMSKKLGKFVDEFVELDHITREDAIKMFDEIRILFNNGRESEITERFLTNSYANKI